MAKSRTQIFHGKRITAKPSKSAAVRTRKPLAAPAPEIPTAASDPAALTVQLATERAARQDAEGRLARIHEVITDTIQPALQHVVETARARGGDVS